MGRYESLLPACLLTGHDSSITHTHLSQCRLTHWKSSDPPHTSSSSSSSSSSSRVGRDCHAPLLFCPSAEGRWFVSLRCWRALKLKNISRNNNVIQLTQRICIEILQGFCKRRTLGKENLYTLLISNTTQHSSSKNHMSSASSSSSSKKSSKVGSCKYLVLREFIEITPLFKL